MKKELIEDIIEWDVENWSKAIDFWNNEITIAMTNLTCLALGERRGGLSLWLAINGNKVICSDLNSPASLASKLIKKYHCEQYISYESIDATKIPYKDYFDLVVFKSILGGISRHGNDKLKKKVFDEIHKCLKPGGKILFAENLEASCLHSYMRKRFVKWGSNWNYLRYEEIPGILGSFKNIKLTTVGVLAAFGRSEGQRKILGKIDRLVERLIPKSKRYIIIGIAEK